jgi:cytochrome c-type biogenesis protein CcsB
MDGLVLSGALLFYLAGTAGYLLYVLKLDETLRILSPASLGVGFLLHSASLVSRAFQAGYLPITNFQESLSFFAWLLVALTLIVQLTTGIVSLGVFVSPIAFVMSLGSIALGKPVRDLPPVLDSFWLPVHVTSAFLGNAVLTLAFSVSLAYLTQEHFVKAKKKLFFFKRLPSLETLDGLNQTFLAWGFPIMTLGILSGGIWARIHWGSDSLWEWRQVLSGLTWLLYALLVHGRLSMGWRGRRAALWTITGFSALFLSYLVVNLFVPGRHGGSFG